MLVLSTHGLFICQFLWDIKRNYLLLYNAMHTFTQSVVVGPYVTKLNVKRVETPKLRCFIMLDNQCKLPVYIYIYMLAKKVVLCFSLIITGNGPMHTKTTQNSYGVDKYSAYKAIVRHCFCTDGFLPNAC